MGARSRSLVHARIDLRTLCAVPTVDALAALAAQFRSALPDLERGALALIDSPRWPRDLDCAAPGVARRPCEIRGRAIDEALRRLIKQTAGLKASVSMFPTPDSAYFYAQIVAPAAKPHLRALGLALLGSSLTPSAPHGGNFTRFMLAGFAAYRALEGLGVSCFEGYPDLQFRVWNGGRRLPSKISGGRIAALEARDHIVAELAARLKISRGGAGGSLDQADAAILALSAAAGLRLGGGVIIEHPAEGRFWLTLAQRTTGCFHVPMIGSCERALT